MLAWLYCDAVAIAFEGLEQGKTVELCVVYRLSEFCLRLVICNMNVAIALFCEPSIFLNIRCPLILIALHLHVLAGKTLLRAARHQLSQ